MIKTQISGRMASIGISAVVFPSVYSEKTCLNKLIMIIIISICVKARDACQAPSICVKARDACQAPSICVKARDACQAPSICVKARDACQAPSIRREWPLYNSKSLPSLKRVTGYVRSLTHNNVKLYLNHCINKVNVGRGHSPGSAHAY